jgi:hypothetical protein
MKVLGNPPQKSITMNTTGEKAKTQAYDWWNAKDDKALMNQVLSTMTYLKENQDYRQRQAAIYARLYGNMSLFSFVGSNMSKMDITHGLPIDRPTFNLIQSAIDTLVSKISQNRPSPTFLTDNGDYKERNLAKKLNNFIQGEFYQMKAYEKAAIMLRDALVEGTGILKVYESTDKKVALDRVLLTELYVDANEGIYGEPRSMYQLKIIDRDVLMSAFPKEKKDIKFAEKAYPDNSSTSSQSVSDMVLVVEAWHMKSHSEAKDGRHTIVCSSGVLVDEEWDKDKFPFVLLHYCPRLLGFWAQGLAEQLMGTQMEINSLLYTISRAIKLVGVPRVFVEAGSKVTKTSFNNEVGGIIEYRGTKPIYEVAPAVPAELYEQLQRLINYGYQQSGVSALDAGAQKPAGLNSGEAIRTYDDISTDRFSALSRRYDNAFVDLAYLVIDLAKDIAERDGSYSTVYPNKNGVKEIELPDIEHLNDPFVIQCFNMSSLPKDPAGRMQKIVEMIQAGMITIREGRRMLDYPDLDQIEKLANASEERIFQTLDKIVEDGEYTPPDPFLDLLLAKDLVVQYYNLYVPCKLEEERAQMLRDFYSQVLGLIQAATPPPQVQGMPGMTAPPTPNGTQAGQPAAAPQPQPASPMVPNGAMQ